MRTVSFKLQGECPFPGFQLLLGAGSSKPLPGSYYHPLPLLPPGFQPLLGAGSSKPLPAPGNRAGVAAPACPRAREAVCRLQGAGGVAGGQRGARGGDTRQVGDGGRRVYIYI